jgi:ketosteroid isomerase-like protein
MTQQQNVETLRRMYEAWNDRDIDALMGNYDPDIEIVETQDLAYAAALLRVLGPRFVILSGGYRGKAEVRKLWETIWEISEWFIVKPEDFIAVGDEQVVVPNVLNARAKGTGAEGEAPTAHLFTVRDRKVLRMQVFVDRQQAMTAAHLPEGVDAGAGETESGTGLAG